MPTGSASCLPCPKRGCKFTVFIFIVQHVFQKKSEEWICFYAGSFPGFFVIQIFIVN